VRKIPGVNRLLLSFRLPSAGAAAVLALAFSHVAGAQVPADPSVVKISSCIVSKPRPFSHRATGTAIAYTNTGPTILHEVTFQVEYRTAGGNLSRTFEDAGIFAPNEPVSHHFAAYSDVEYHGAKPVSCLVTAVR
jgi:hypothetical protein